MRKSVPRYVANFDSASAMVRATSNFLNGDDFPAIGQSPMLKPLARAVNLAPRQAREVIFGLGGLMEAISPELIEQVDGEELSAWVTQRYPQRRYPAAMIGSSNGALVHLCAALGTPWLPQTFLIPVRQLGVDRDEPKEAMAMGARYGPRLLAANPDFQLHHMHDANQDRLMVEYMDYYRIKRRRLGPTYERFLREHLEPGAPIIVVECQRTWPTTRIGERHVFQHGALGGATEEEFLRGSKRVEEYLERYKSHRRRWDSPEPDGESPEAEWGFEPTLRSDIEEFARRHGHPVKRLVFTEPEDLSPLVADLYRAWNRERGLRANRLLIESFILLEPYWTLRTGSVPYWMKFNMEPSLAAAERYVDSREAFDEINLMLFNHGAEAVGLPPIDRWRDLLARARRRGRFLGVREDLFPLDFGALGRYHDAVQEIPARYPLPGPMHLSRFFDFLEGAADRYEVRLEDV